MATKPLSVFIALWVVVRALAADLPAPAITSDTNSPGAAVNFTPPAGAAGLREKAGIELHFPNKDQLTSAWHLIAITNAERKNENGVRDALDNLRRIDPAKARDCARELRRSYPKLDLPVESE